MARPKLNKKNLLAFADELYAEDDDGVSWMPLCDKTLARANGEILHCVLGELYERFVGPTARRATKKELAKNVLSLAQMKKRRRLLSGFKVVLNVNGESFAANELWSRAILKERPIKPGIFITNYHYKFQDELNNLPHTNDARPKGMSEKAQIARAQRVQSKLRAIAEECLG